MRDRNSNIELLRIILILGIIILHYCNPSIGGGLKYVAPNGLNYWILHFLVSSFACAVDLFMLISGYFYASSLKVDLWKSIRLVVQVIVFSISIYILRCLFGYADFNINTFILCLIPTNYFVILYVAVYIISPYINLLISSLDVKQTRNLFLILMLLFSVYPTVVDVLGEVLGHKFMGLSTIGIFGSQWGYTIVTFSLMYIIGTILKRDEGCIQCLRDKSKYLLCLFIVIVTCWSIFYRGQGIYWYYHNPLIMLNAVFVFVIFSNLKISPYKIINSMAKSVFTVFLLHHYFFQYLKISVYVVQSPFVMLIHLLGSAVCIFLILYPIGVFYNLMETSLINKLKKYIRLPVIDLNKY